MTYRKIRASIMEPRRLSHPVLAFGNAREPLRPFRIHNRQVEAGSGAAITVIEDDGVDDFPIRSGEPEDMQDAGDDGLDIQDLLLDETD
jgi:hypothetical protein